MHKILAPFCLLLLLSCSKDEEIVQPGPIPPIVVDSLGLWKKHTTGSTAAIWDIRFVDPARGFLCDADGIKRTVDSGKTWTQVLAKINAYYTMQFLDQQHGYCVGQELALTTDGGNNWTVKPLPTTNAIDIFFTSPSTGFLAADIGLYRTTDTGSTWTMIKQDLWTALHFNDAANGWGATSRPAVIYKTMDGGLTWSVQKNLQSALNVYTIFFIGLSGWTTTNGPLVSTSDAGQTWVSRPGPGNAFDVQFVDQATGYMTTSNTIVKSADGGVTWRTEAILASKRLIELFFTDPHHGWAAGEGGTVLRYKAP